MDILSRLARFLDRPLFPWKQLLLSFSVGQFCVESFLSLRHYRVLQHKKPPKLFEANVTQELYDKSQAYGRAKLKFGLVKGLIGQMINISFIKFDVLPKLWSWSGRLLLDWAPAGFTGEISHSIVFVLAFVVIQTVLDIPGSLYHHFVLEEKFGFNKQTPKLFVTDLLKTQMLTFVLTPPILGAFLKIILTTGDKFFLALWAFAAGMQVFMITAYPLLIQPLFNKLTPLEEGEVKSQTEELAKKLKFPLHELFVIDGSKRSSHSNAYFFGLPWKKRIVIFDTLIEKTSPPEIVAVLAHELGHWSLGHTTKLFAISQFHLLYIFALFSAFIGNNSLYSDFGFALEKPIIIGFLLFSDAFAPMDMIVKLMMNVLSRKFEYEADEFAKGLGYKKELAGSLIKLHVQNLSSMEVDWMYSTYHNSHPILSERLEAIGWVPDGKVVQEEKDDKEGGGQATGVEL